MQLLGFFQRSIFFILLCVSLCNLAIAEPQPKAGVDYKITTAMPPIGIRVESNSVIEFFNPGCPACFRTEPAVEKWLQKKPGNVVFSRVPVMFHSNWEIYARAYYVAVNLNIQDQLVPILFNLIHVQRNPVDSMQSMIPVFTEINDNLTPAQITEAFNSITVDEQISQAKEMMVAYQVDQIPTILVGDKYMVNGSMAKSPEKMLQTVNYLIKLSAQDARNAQAAQAAAAANKAKK